MKSVKTLPNYPQARVANLLKSDLNRRSYSMPVLRKGKQITSVPKGSNKLAEQAKQAWYVEFFYNHPLTNKKVRFRVTNGLNRIKVAIDKQEAFEELLSSYRILLENGYNPFEKQSEKQIVQKLEPLTILQAVEAFIGYHQAKRTRANSIKSYLSKINQFVNYIGVNKKIVDITENDVIGYLSEYESLKKWTGVTYNYAKISLNNLFKYLVTHKYVDKNPVAHIERRKKVKTELHQVFTDDDFRLIMEWLRTNDPYCLLFVQMIYYTCIRPKELRLTQLKYLDLANERIVIPAHVSKNKKALPVKIDSALMAELNKLELSSYPLDYYLFGDTQTIVGPRKIGENTPYNRFHKCLKELNMLNKKYTLYSFKHLSNVRKYLAGWSIAEICSANRHSSLVETETYLKDLVKFIPVTKIIPVI